MDDYAILTIVQYIDYQYIIPPYTKAEFLLFENRDRFANFVQFQSAQIRFFRTDTKNQIIEPPYKY